MDNNYIIAKNKLEKYGQEHLLNFYNKLDENNQKELVKDILDTDFEQMRNLYKNINNTSNEINTNIEPIPYINKEDLSECEKNYYNRIGESVIKNGQYAVVTMAGGQRDKAWTYWSKRNL